MNINVDFVIYIYMIACISLMTFDFVYIFRTKRKKRRKKQDERRWHYKILSQIKRISEGKNIDPQHIRMLSTHLTNMNSLISYTQALERIKREYPEQLINYIQKNNQLFQVLAYKYSRKDSMERAFYADFIRRFPPYAGDGYKPLLDILISYLDDSTVFCRENVLCALYVMGNVQAVVNALQIIDDRRWFHHQKLISDGMATFAGDKQALTSALWSKYKKWDNYLMLAIVQFITLSSQDYKEIFFPVLTDSNADIEIRLAILRYFRKYPYEPVRPVLLEFLSGGSGIDENLTIVSAFVISRYPGSDTVLSLTKALSSSNWYVRHNAAASIIEIGASDAELNAILDGDDKYAREILLYKLEQNGFELSNDRKAVCT